MRNLLFIFIINTSLVFHSQDCIKPFDNQIKDVTSTNTGDFVFISDDFKITKVDSNFDTIWHNNYLDTTNNLIFKIQSTFDGGFIGAGNNSGTYLYKMNSFGDTVWTNECQLFFGPFSGVNIIDIIQTADSGYAFMGIYGHMSYYSIVVKTDRFGDTLWTKKNILSAPNVYDNQVKTISETNNGDLIVSGLVNVSFPTPSKYSYLYKLNSIGDSIWAKTYDNFQFNSVEPDSIGNLIIAGQIITNSNVIEPKIIKTNSLGDTLWTKSIQTDYLNCVKLTDGGYVFGGFKESIQNNNSSYLLKTNINGNTLWSRVFEQDTINTEVKMIFNLNSNDYLLLGQEISNFPFSINQINYKIQVDSLGLCQGQNPSNFISILTKSVVFYPNPTKEDINISIENFNGNIQTEVYDLIGNKLQITSETTISLQEYAIGIYILKVAYGDRVEKLKVIKE
ncbi:T9SS type A sorting domain-containing protein [Flavobacteriales bacterium]|nr:T9SS type A sorting domain-containing protein [Flavobacteriales bacterium]